MTDALLAGLGLGLFAGFWLCEASHRYQQQRARAMRERADAVLDGALAELREFRLEQIRHTQSPERAAVDRLLRSL